MEELPQHAGPDVVFDRFSLNMHKRTLSSGGLRVPLHDRAFDVLAFLVTNRDRVVTRQEILSDVFGSHLSDDQNVKTQVSTVRIALRRAGCTEDLIQTRGATYRFIGDVAPPASAGEDDDATFAPPSEALSPNRPEPQSRSRLRSLAAGLVCVSLLGCAMLWAGWWSGTPKPARLSIVVLPFRSFGVDPAQDALAESIGDDLTTDLAQLPASTVIARESAVSFKGKSLTVQQIAERLNVRYVVEGSLRAENMHYHVNVSLIDAASGVKLSADNFDFQPDAQADMREQIVHKLASILHFRIDQQAGARSVHDRPNDPDALDLFFRARSRLDYDHTEKGFAFAQAHLEGAVTQQPGFADAQAELGWLLLRKVSTTSDPDEAADLALARLAIGKALSLSPGHPLAHAAHARLLELSGDCAAAQSDIDQALALEPGSLPAHTVLATCALDAARFEEAAAQYETILRLNPLGYSNKPRFSALGVISLIQGRYDEAIDWFERAHTDDAASEGPLGPSEEARVMLIAARELRGDNVAAQALARSYTAEFPGRTVWRIGTYLPARWLALPRVQQVLHALQEAGVPRDAGEDAPGLRAGAPCVGDDFALTPPSLQGVAALRTAELERSLAATPPPLVIDLGSGTSPISGAHIYDSTKDLSMNEWVTKEVQAFARPGATVVLMGDGPTGCAAYAAGDTLIKSGFAIRWYRGGEEAWHFRKVGAAKDQMTSK